MWTSSHDALAARSNSADVDVIRSRRAATCSAHFAAGQAHRRRNSGAVRGDNRADIRDAKTGAHLHSRYSRPRAGRSPIATACRWRRIGSATISRSIFRRRSILPTRKCSTSHTDRIAARLEKLIGRAIQIPDEAILRHYHNRGILPFEIAHESFRQRIGRGQRSIAAGDDFTRRLPARLSAGNTPVRSSATAARPDVTPDGIIDNHETLWPETEGREGIEQTFNAMLSGKHGEYKMTFDKDGRKTSEKIAIAACARTHRGNDARRAFAGAGGESARGKAKRGAIVIIDPNNGDILALASWPDYDPNVFVPFISAEKFKALQDDPDIPLLPRAFRSAYPPGSTFKVAVGIAALESGTVSPNDEYQCVPSLDDRQRHLSQLEKERSRLAEFRAGADGIVRHLVLSGRDQDGRGADHRLGAEARFRRQMRNSDPR